MKCHAVTACLLQVACSQAPTPAPAVQDVDIEPLTLDDVESFTLHDFTRQVDGGRSGPAGHPHVASILQWEAGAAHISEGAEFIGLSAERGVPFPFTVTGVDPDQETFHLVYTGPAASTPPDDTVGVWLLWSASGRPVPATEARLLTDLGDIKRPAQETTHELRVAMDLDGDGIADLAAFNHHCKNEGAPYPLDPTGRQEWEAEHGAVDWDYMCSRRYRRRAGTWVQGERLTPM